MLSSGVKSACADGGLTSGASHLAVAKTIRFGQGGETSAPDQFHFHSTIPRAGLFRARRGFEGNAVAAFAGVFPDDVVTDSMLLNSGCLEWNGCETSFFQNSKRLGSAMASGLCGMP